MNDFIRVLTNFYIDLFTVDIFLYFIAGFCLLSVVLLILRLARG